MKRKFFINIGLLTIISTPIIAIISCSSNSYNLSALKKAMIYSNDEMILEDGTIIKGEIVHKITDQITNIQNNTKRSFKELKDKIDAGVSQMLNSPQWKNASSNNSLYKWSHTTTQKYKTTYNHVMNLINQKHIKKAVSEIEEFERKFGERYKRDWEKLNDQDKKNGPYNGQKIKSLVTPSLITSTILEIKKGWKATFNWGGIKGLTKSAKLQIQIAIKMYFNELNINIVFK
ncbi:MAG: hypothetical protein GY679_02510 [Mycoplasma sp.]|nr:hypothetical protein [Mycoplasma sp.]